MSVRLTINQPVSFQDLVEHRVDEFPLLYRAATNTKPARNPKIEWLTKVELDPVPTATKLTTNWNYCQLFRQSYTRNQEEAVTVLLTVVEHTLREGIRGVENTNWRKCGGVRNLLGRDANDTDVLTLRPLRQPILRVSGWDYYTIFAETSLQVLTAEQAAASAERKAEAREARVA